MTAIERTAYPQLKANPTPVELAERFTPLPDDLVLARAAARGSSQQLAFLVLLKCFHVLTYFPDLDRVPMRIVQYMRTCLELSPQTPCTAPKRSRLRYHAIIRKHLGMTFAPDRARHVASIAMREAARTMDHPADLINAALEMLSKDKLETPAFSTLDRIAGRERTAVNAHYFAQVTERLSDHDRATVASLLIADPQTGHSPLSRVKDVPASATLSHIDAWIQRLSWVDAQVDTQRLLDDIPAVKLRHFWGEARSLDVAELRDIQQPKRTVLVLALLHYTRITTIDELI